jgi:hypothetical protein
MVCVLRFSDPTQLKFRLMSPITSRARSSNHLGVVILTRENKFHLSAELAQLFSLVKPSENKSNRSGASSSGLFPQVKKTKLTPKRVQPAAFYEMAAPF